MYVQGALRSTVRPREKRAALQINESELHLLHLGLEKRTEATEQGGAEGSGEAHHNHTHPATRGPGQIIPDPVRMPVYKDIGSSGKGAS